jgi:hypothetical protein
VDVDVTEHVTESVGDLGEEAAKLFAAAQQWWRESHGDPAGFAGDDAEHTAHVGPECAICPLCQLLAMLRHARPEVFEHLAGAATSLVHAVKATFEHQGGGWSRPDGTPTVERIDIR